jgi:hypothetical protein
MLRNILTALALTTVLAGGVATVTQASANASVAVDNGSGFVGKGDVQTALGGINDAALQTKWTAKQITFTAKVTEVSGIQWGCSDGTTERFVATQVSTKPLTVTANTNAAGKVTNGFNVKGIDTSAAGTVLSTDYKGEWSWGVCGEHGSRTTGLSFFTDAPVVDSGIFVNGVALPNTPIV